jgi:predicted nucleic acid-binding protein
MSAHDLDRALGSTQRVLLDTSTLIAFHTSHEAVHPLAVHLMARIEDDGDPLHGYYSAISAAELLVRPIRTSLTRFAHMQTFLSHFPHLTVIPADLAIAAQAATLRAIRKVSIGDAFIMATGLVSGCEAIISNDDRWKRAMAPLFREFNWIYLADYL